ncbi:(2Fe-2S) ferredoxin domain-containing protein [Streptomyces sp. NPDC008086]|uniref:(2Fe-2S) ferredoxin domain-containing protein n=1 Tax=Streptomyces sp. NPDC008086 TaxID=3364807 RepID=UPI0036E3CB7F
MPMAVSRDGAVPCRVVVCRDCCCGSPKVTGVDHGEQTARLAEDAPVRVTECLDVCEQANVIVVQPSSEGRAAGGRPVWFGLVNDPAATEDIAAWVRAGGPGIAELPDILDLYLFTPPRRARAGNSVSSAAAAARQLPRLTRRA